MEHFVTLCLCFIVLWTVCKLDGWYTNWIKDYDNDDDEDNEKRFDNTRKREGENNRESCVTLKAWNKISLDMIHGTFKITCCIRHKLLWTLARFLGCPYNLFAIAAAGCNRSNLLGNSSTHGCFTHWNSGKSRAETSKQFSAQCMIKLWNLLPLSQQRLYTFIEGKIIRWQMLGFGEWQWRAQRQGCVSPITCLASPK